MERMVKLKSAGVNEAVTVTLDIRSAVALAYELDIRDIDWVMSELDGPIICESIQDSFVIDECEGDEYG